MFAETGLHFPYFQTFSQVQQLDEFCRSHKSSGSLANLIQTSTVSEYDLGGEGDLFKAPEPIIEEPIIGIDPMTAAISMISGEDVISSQLLVSDIESIENAQLLSEVFYECKKDLLAKEETETPLSEVLNIITPINRIDENIAVEEKMNIPRVLFSKSVSSRCISTMEWIPDDANRPNFLDFSTVDFGVNGMRRAFSEGDIKTLAYGVSIGQPQAISNNETRKQKLSRYWNKKSKRNFGRKIKYACRKALADSQPRIRGRFARTEESESGKNQ